MKVATAAYPLDLFTGWQAYEDKMRAWVAEAAAAGATLLVFPEFGAMELASLSSVPEGAEADPVDVLRRVSEAMPRAGLVLADLAVEFGVYILGGSAPVAVAGHAVNRAALYSPEGGISHQDKQIVTLFERDWGVAAGDGLRVFDTSVGRLGVLICYDCEFPLLARALIEAEVEVILIPSCTEALSGYWRVRIGAMARALEGQCVTVMASVVGERPEIYGVETNTGMGGIFGPPDSGFPDTGVISEGQMNVAGWTYGEIDLEQVRLVRREGCVRNKAHWVEQLGLDGKPDLIELG